MTPYFLPTLYILFCFCKGGLNRTTRRDDILTNIGINKSDYEYNILEFNKKSKEAVHKVSRFINMSVPGLANNTWVTFQRVLVYDEVETFLDFIPSQRRPYRRIFVDVIGRTFEGRHVRLVRIENSRAKHTIVIDANMHGMEWLSLMTALYAIQTVIRADISASSNDLNWYIIPCVNPDGLVESQKHGTLYKKNKNKTGCSGSCAASSCGVDLNRNFPFKWEWIDEHCQENYAGPHPFSESESSAIRKTLLHFGQDLVLYLSIHSPHCSFQYPWSYEPVKVPDYRDLYEAAIIAIRDMNRQPLTCKYSVEHAGKHCESQGSVIDYVRRKLRLKYVYVLDVQRSGHKGYFPVNEHIKRMVTDNFAGIMTLALYVKSRSPGGSTASSGRHLRFESCRSLCFSYCCMIVYIIISDK